MQPELNHAQRIQGLQTEARRLAIEHVQTLLSAAAEVCQLATEIADGGDAFPPGVRDVARRVAEELDVRAQTIDGIMGKVR